MPHAWIVHAVVDLMDSYKPSDDGFMRDIHDGTAHKRRLAEAQVCSA